MTVLLYLGTAALVFICLFMVLVILMQRAKSDGGVGAALGGGMAESAFGGETSNVLSRATTYAAIMFFLLAFALYLGWLHEHRVAISETPEGLPTSPELMPSAPETLPEVAPDPSGITPSDGGSLTPPPAEAPPPEAETVPPAENEASEGAATENAPAETP